MTIIRVVKNETLAIEIELAPVMILKILVADVTNKNTQAFILLIFKTAVAVDVNHTIII